MKNKTIEHCESLYEVIGELEIDNIKFEIATTKGKYIVRVTEYIRLLKLFKVKKRRGLMDFTYVYPDWKNKYPLDCITKDKRVLLNQFENVCNMYLLDTSSSMEDIQGVFLSPTDKKVLL